MSLQRMNTDIAILPGIRLDTPDASMQAEQTKTIALHAAAQLVNKYIKYTNKIRDI